MGKLITNKDDMIGKVISKVELLGDTSLDIFYNRIGQIFDDGDYCIIKSFWNAGNSEVSIKLVKNPKNKDLLKMGIITQKTYDEERKMYLKFKKKYHDI